MPEQKPPLFARFIRRMMIIFFRLLYHSFSWTYDLVAATVSVGRWQRWVLSTASLINGSRILELGYGPGHLQNHFLSLPVTAFGLDESFQMARQASNRLRKTGQTPRLARGLAQALPYPNAAFDTVVATFPTPYIIDPRTLAEVQRVLKPGGRLVVLMAAWITGKSPADRFMAFIFRLTGEAPDEQQDLSEVIRPYQAAGFNPSIRFMDESGSRLMFIIAAK